MAVEIVTTQDSSLFYSANANSWMTNKNMIVQVQEGHPFIYATTSKGFKTCATPLMMNHEAASRCSNGLTNESQSVEFNDFERISLLCGGFLLVSLKRHNSDCYSQSNNSK